MPTWLIAALVVFVVFVIAQQLLRGGGRKSKSSRSRISETRHSGPGSSRGAGVQVDADMDEELLHTLRHHGKINAIKDLRDATGWGLKESKDYVDNLERQNPQAGGEYVASSPTNPWEKSGNDDLDQFAPTDRERLLSEIRKGRKINAIKIYRELTNQGLKESKDAVEKIERLGLHR